MKPLWIALASLFFLQNPGRAQNYEELKKIFREHYAQFVERGNIFLDAGPNYSVEKTPDGHYLKKTYYFETGRQTTRISYADDRLQKPDGKAVEWYDDGRLWSEGEYKNGLKGGFWKEEGTEYGLQMAYGTYVEGKKEGQWVAFDSLKNRCEAQYKEGKLVGSPQYFNPDGSVDTARLTRFLKRMGGDADFMDIPPVFPCRKKYANEGRKCGEKSLLDYLGNTIEYPEKARQLGIEGTAILEFVVEKDGSVVDVIALRGICDDIKKECLRVVNKMPRWNPGMIEDKPVRVRFKLPVRFKLE